MAKKKSKKAKAKAKRSKQRSKKSKAISSDSSSISSSDTEAETPVTASTSSSSVPSADDTAKLKAQLAQLQAAQSKPPDLTALAKTLELQKTLTEASNATATTTTAAKKNVMEFKRLDQVWDSTLRDYKFKESTEEVKDEFDCVFTVRRRFNWEDKYVGTWIDIKSKTLRNALQIIYKDCRSISLVEDKPSIHPHMLFHYYKEIKAYVKKTLKQQLKKAKKKSEKKAVKQQIVQCKLLLKYIDEDYEKTRKALKPMLKAGMYTKPSVL